jgi:hypothetical protein
MEAISKIIASFNGYIMRVKLKQFKKPRINNVVSVKPLPRQLNESNLEINKVDETRMDSIEVQSVNS